ncbi:hypothetical protein BH23BAC3_BH23BAC3_01750 [soil metagenome]
MLLTVYVGRLESNSERRMAFNPFYHYNYVLITLNEDKRLNCHAGKSNSQKSSFKASQKC